MRESAGDAGPPVGPHRTVGGSAGAVKGRDRPAAAGRGPRTPIDRTPPGVLRFAPLPPNAATMSRPRPHRPRAAGVRTACATLLCAAAWGGFAAAAVGGDEVAVTDGVLRVRTPRDVFSHAPFHTASAWDDVVRPLAVHRGDAAPVRPTASLLSKLTRTRGRVRVDYLTDFTGTQRAGVQGVSSSWIAGLALDAEGEYWMTDRPAPVPEGLPEGGDGRFGGDFWAGDANLIATLVNHPRGKLRTGGGAAWIVPDGANGGGGVEVGPQATAALDVYLLGRAMVAGELDTGFIGDDDLLRWRLSAGATWPWCETRAGYERFTLGDETLDGYFAALVVWY